ncbi:MULTISPECIES: M56 family metallopeptidase [unclassified Pseudonocardia]|uniref:M56 family metallopeptidase n=1 Tax=unclassified Pseudonocardia TaxID=2619320 RepID=UPI000964A053|nr:MULTISPECIES: M56 family metallopeptidase [unclassified Pseudonocardia]MBN9098041.1 M56 family metallopeptidase [Pseudonocardia sp.]OJY54450.1 MAG: hypothetical protein BGP03_23175 [Pseudonocardia sp. 73-21]
MTTTLAVLLGAIFVSAAAPRWLRRVESSQVQPSVTLSCWWSVVAGVIGAVVVALVLLVLPDRAGVSLLGQFADVCVSALGHARNPRLEEVLALGTAAVLCAVFLRVLYVGGWAAVRRRRHVRGHLDLLGQFGRSEAQILWVPHDTPLAFSVAGRRPVIVATSALDDDLPVESVRAVLAHERAHLAGRHHFQIALADALAAAAPGIPLFAHAPGAVRRLVEFAADATAARLHGNDAVVLALGVMGHQTGPPGGLAMAGDDLDARLRRLGRPARPAGRGRTAVVHMGGVATSAVLPAIAAAAMVVSVGLVACV